MVDNNTQSSLIGIDNITKGFSKAGRIYINSATAVEREVSFPAFITQFSDNYNVGWGGDQPFGRTDPVKNYQNTTRQISISFDILGESRDHAIENFKSLEILTTMLYPVFSSAIGTNNKARTIAAPPLWRIRYANYIQSPLHDKGLLGCVSGFTFQPKFEVGHFITSDGNLIPLSYSVALQFQPLHEHPLGYDSSGGRLQDNWPWGASLNKIADAPVSEGDPSS